MTCWTDLAAPDRPARPDGDDPGAVRRHAAARSDAERAAPPGRPGCEAAARRGEAPPRRVAGSIEGRVVERLVAELSAGTGRRGSAEPIGGAVGLLCAVRPVVRSVVRQARRDLSGVPAGAEPELLERLARERLRQRGQRLPAGRGVPGRGPAVA